jgi:hypothetical protein
MKQPTPSEYLQYAQQMSKLRAQQEMEKLRLVYAQHQYVLEQVPHLKPAFEALLVLDKTRDYALLAQQINQNLVDLEAWLLNTWQPALESFPELNLDDFSRDIDLFQFRRLPDAFEKLLSLFIKWRNIEEEIKRSDEERVKRLAETQAKREAEDQALYQSYWFGFEKVGLYGEILPLTAPQWAAVKDMSTGLIWATNWAQGDDFPVTGVLSWYQSGVRLVEEKGFFSTKTVEKPYTDGYFNDGKNTESHIQRVNQQRWCGQQDWYLPSKEELELLANALHLNGAYSLERYQAIFPNDEVGHFWSASPIAYSNSAWDVFFFCHGKALRNSKTSHFHVRAVRAG